MEASQPEQYDLEAGAELRFELEEDEAIAIKVSQILAAAPDVNP